MTLTRKLVLALTTVAIVPIAVLLWVLVAPATRDSEIYVGMQMQENVDQAARFINQFLMNSERDLESFAADASLISADTKKMSARLEQLAYHYPHFRRLSFVTPDRIVVASSDPKLVGKPAPEALDMSAQDYGRTPHSVIVSGFDPGSGRTDTAPENRPVASSDLQLKLLAPVRRPDGSDAGMLVGDLTDHQLRDVIEDVQRHLRGHNQIYLLLEDGRILMSTDREMTPSRPHPDFAATFKPRFAAANTGNFVYRDVLGQRFMAAHSRTGEHADNGARHRLVSWRVLATVSYKVVMAPVAVAAKKALGVLAAALIVAVLCGLLLARSLAHPVLRLTNELRQEITERQRSEEALRNSNERFEMTMLATTNCIWDWHMREDTLWWNTNFCTVFGYAPEEVGTNAESWSRRVHPDDVQRVFKGIHDVIDGGGTLWTDEYRFRRSDGTYAIVLDRGYLVRDESGQAMRMIGAMQDISRRKSAETELEAIHKQLLDASRRAGMAEIASNVLHNVGNVLNSVNVSATLVSERVRRSKSASLAKVVALMREHAADLGSFITTDPRGKHLPAFLAELSQQLGIEQQECAKEIESLRENIDHIKEIVNMQQSYATVSGLREILNPVSLVEDSLRMNAGALTRHGVTVVREYEPVPEINVDKHRVLQILVNLVRNAKYACDESDQEDKRVTVRVSHAGSRIKITVIDNGVGIPPENLTRIFNHGFTTRKHGHGFGLHSGALAAKELGGSLSVHSDGAGCGATFTLELPLDTTAEMPVFVPTEERRIA